MSHRGKQNDFIIFFYTKTNKTTTFNLNGSRDLWRHKQRVENIKYSVSLLHLEITKYYKEKIFYRVDDVKKTYLILVYGITW